MEEKKQFSIDDVSVYWLSNGGQIIGLMYDKSDSSIFLKNPYYVIRSATEDGEEMFVVDAVPYAEEDSKTVEIPRANIVGIIKPSQEFYTYYISNVVSQEEEVEKERVLERAKSGEKVVSLKRRK